MRTAHLCVEVVVGRYLESEWCALRTLQINGMLCASCLEMSPMSVKKNKVIASWLLLSASLCANIAFAAPNLSLGAVSQVLPGQTVSIPVTFDNDAAVVGLQFDVQYDDAQLDAGGALAGAVLTATGHGVSSSSIAIDTVRVVIAPPSDNAAGRVHTVHQCSGR